MTIKTPEQVAVDAMTALYFGADLPEGAAKSDADLDHAWRSGWMEGSQIPGLIAAAVEADRAQRHPRSLPAGDRPHRGDNVTPYDTGARLEPMVWVTPGRRPAEHDDERYGKVDLDNDGGTTIATVHAERVDGTYVLVVYSHETDSTARINLHADLDIYDVSHRGTGEGVEFQGVTPRGFGYSEFATFDRSNAVVLEVQESSLATQRMLWIGTHGGRIHANEGRVRELRDLLTHWLDKED